MKKFKFLTSLTTLGVVATTVPVVATSCSNSINATAVVLDGSTIIDAANADPQGDSVMGVLTVNGQIADLVPDSVTATVDSKDVFCMGVYTYHPILGLPLFVLQMALLNPKIIPEGKDSVQITATIKAITKSRQQITATLPITYAKTNYALGLVDEDDEAISNYWLFPNDGNMTFPSQVVYLSYTNFGKSMASTADEITVSPESAADGKLTATVDKNNNEITFACDKECKAGTYEFKIEATVTPSGTNDPVIVSTTYKITVQDIKPAIGLDFNHGGKINVITEQGQKITVENGDYIKLGIYSSNEIYAITANNSGFYTYKATEKGQTQLPTGVTYDSTNKKLDIDSGLASKAQIELILTDAATQNEKYASITITLVPKQG